ncbi:NRAMP family divalent metal transporter [Ferrimicrobium sp.]|uniref:NRAMP family divalent metal transporter n=1 Tax=Ferrimicrobium sp. TaxID=2926050 RepID=UPI00260B13DA|nr:NRAMP family divalent metal transporter [Ferrimicrobium sp.]
MQNLDPRVDNDESAIRGGLGKITFTELRSSPSFKRKLLALLAVIGPGIIVMVGDNDAGGITTYAQAGQAYGYSLLWLMPVLVIVLAVSQEMVVRLGAVTGVGHGKLLKERFGRFWAAFSVVDLFVLNLLTLITEFIGVRYALGYFGVPPAIAVTLMGIVLVAAVASGRFERWERFMLILVLVSLLVVPLVLLTPWHAGGIATGMLIPGVKGGITSTATIFIIGIVGTTIAPWQLFFQQSNVVDKRITPRWIKYERADTFLGSIVTNVAGALVMVAAAAVFVGFKVGAFQNAGVLAEGFAKHAGSIAGVIFAIILLEASLIGAATVTLSTSYALGDLFGVDQSLNTPVREAKGFYASYVILVAISAGVVLIPSLPLSLVNLAVQVLAGVLLPSALLFLLLLCNDKGIMGPWINPPWLNVLATFIVSLLLQLSLILTIVTVFPTISVTGLLVGTFIPVVAVTVGVAYYQFKVREREEIDKAARLSWSMPAAALLHRPVQSRGRSLILLFVRVYLIIAVVLMVVSFFRLGS